MAKPGPAVQPKRGGTHAFKRRQPISQSFGQGFGVFAFHLFGRDQQAGFQPSEPGGHDQPIGSQFQPDAARAFDHRQELLHQSDNGDLGQIHLLRPGEFQQQIKRAFIAFKLQLQGGFAHLSRYPCPVSMRTKSKAGATTPRKNQPMGS